MAVRRTEEVCSLRTNKQRERPSSERLCPGHGAGGTHAGHRPSPPDEAQSADRWEVSLSLRSPRPARRSLCPGEAGEPRCARPCVAAGDRPPATTGTVSDSVREDGRAAAGTHFANNAATRGTCIRLLSSGGTPNASARTPTLQPPRCSSHPDTTGGWTWGQGGPLSQGQAWDSPCFQG